MEEKISLALAVKLQLVFEKEETFLTYPLGVGFSYKYLDFMKEQSDLTPQEQLNFKGDFSRQLNIIPDDTVRFIPDSNRILWNEIKHVLTNANFAQSALTDEESKQLEEAIDFLRDTEQDDEGNIIPIYSLAVSKYYQYREVYDEAKRTYLDEKISVECAAGPEAEQLKQIWDSKRKKELNALVQKAEQDWINLGFKNQVEYYQGLLNDLEAKKYLNNYRSAYLNDINISELFDLEGNGIGYYTTFFSPYDAFDENLQWTKLTLSRGEINTLIQKASPELKVIFGGGQGSQDIEKISLEYNNVVVMRPWFRPEFFNNRHWKLEEDSIVSDGNIPRKGKIPAYITSMIVARNVYITKKKKALPAETVFPLLKKVPINKLKMATIVEPVKPVTKAKMPKTQGKGLGLMLLRMRKPTISATPNRIHSASAPRTSRGKSTFVAAIPTKKPGRILPKRVATSLSKRALLKQKLNYSKIKIHGTAIKSLKPEIKLIATSQPPPKPDYVTEKHNFDGVVVLAYVCKRVPKSPNPDSSLLW